MSYISHTHLQGIKHGLYHIFRELNMGSISHAHLQGIIKYGLYHIHIFRELNTSISHTHLQGIKHGFNITYTSSGN
jgi:hypothetical protein